MNIHKNISLQAYNTFGIEQKAALLIEAYDTKDILEALRSYPNLIVLGGGSNILLTQEIQTPHTENHAKGNLCRKRDRLTCMDQSTSWRSLE